MDWRAAFLENWPYKVTAFVLALLLWVTVSGEERQEQPVPTQVRWELADTTWALVEAPREVETVFQGRIADIMALAGDRPVIRYRIESVADSTVEVNLRSDMVEYGAVQGVRPIRVQPSEVELRLESRYSARVPVRPSLDVSAAEGYELVGPPRIQPDSVTLTGPRSEVRSITSVTTESVAISALTASTRRNLRVRLPGNPRNVEADPPIVLASVRVDSLVRRSFRLAVEVRGDREGTFALDPDSVSVELRGPARVIQRLTPDSVAAYVNAFGSLEPGATRSVSVVFPQDRGLSAAPDPGEVAIRRAETP